MQRILVPTDFSREAENALQTAIPIAKAFKSTLIILHVLEVTSKGLFNSTGQNKTYDVKLHEDLKAAQENLQRSTTLHSLDSIDIKYESIIRIGSVGNQIDTFIESEAIDLVVMGTKSAWGLNDVLLGTTTDKLLRRVNCPVLSVNKVIPVESFKKIVFPTTTLNKETKLLRVINKLQQLFDAKIYLVRINTPQNFLPDKNSIQLLDKYAAEHELRNCQSYVYSHTEEEEGIRDFAELKNAGIIAVATSAHTGIWKIIQGSVTKELVSHSTRPVLTVKLD